MFDDTGRHAAGGAAADNKDVLCLLPIEMVNDATEMDTIGATIMMKMIVFDVFCASFEMMRF